MSRPFEKVALVGAGAVGSYYGGRLAERGEDVTFLLRSDYDAVARQGLRVDSVHGDFHLPAPRIARSAAEIGPVDLVVLAWKATANPLLPEVLPPLLDENTMVLTLQNGLGNCEEIAAITGPERVLGGLCFVCINRVAPGHIVHTAGGKVNIGAWHEAGRDSAAEVVWRFSAAGVRAGLTEDLGAAQWQKLIWNIPFNGLAIAEGGVTTDVLLASAETTAEIRALMLETVAAARALGFELNENLVEQNIERTRPMGGYRPSSMIDYVEGREVETAAIWAEPLRRARAAGVSMPHLECLLERIRRRLAARDAGKTKSASPP